jgi:uncharacterized membrane protein
LEGLLPSSIFLLAIFFLSLNFKPKNLILRHTHKQLLALIYLIFQKKKKEKKARFLQQFVPACSKNRQGFLHFCAFILSGIKFSCG